MPEFILPSVGFGRERSIFVLALSLLWSRAGVMRASVPEGWGEEGKEVFVSEPL